MYVIYWTQLEGQEARPCSRTFDTGDLKTALEFMEVLRGRQRAGAGIAFVTMCSEHPDSVGRPGAADPDPDYNWKKRRS